MVSASKSHILDVELPADLFSGQATVEGGFVSNAAASILPSHCLGTAGTAGSAGGTIGTIGTFGSYG